MQTLFENVLTASLYGSVIIVALVLARPLLKKLPKKYLCLLWLLAFLRLLMPFEIPFDLSLQPDMAAITQPQAVVQPTIQVLPEPIPAVPENAPMPEDVEVVYSDAFTPPESIPEGLESYYPPAEEGSQPLVIDWNRIGFYVWAAVACGLAGYSLLSFLLLKRRVREAVRCRDGVWECAGLETAFILGWVRPRVYLPMGLSADTRHHILRHERAHLKRRDHWLKLLGFLALAVHWFNPLVWAAWVLLCRDMELACDEQVVKDMGLSERKDYSAALLRCSTAKEHYLACPVAFGEVSVKARILSVLNYRRPRFWISLIGIVAILFVVVFFMTSPANPPEELAWAVHLRERNVASVELYCKTEITRSDEVYHRYEEKELPQIIRYINDIDAQVSSEQKDWEPVAALVVTMKDGTVHRLEKCGNIFLTVDDVFCVSDAGWLDRFPRTGNVLAEAEPDLSFLNYKNAISLAAEQKKVMAIYCVDSSICPGEVWGDDLAKLLDTADWQDRRTVPGDQSSPGSIEFIIGDDYRITLFDRKFARVKYGEEVRYYHIPQETYEYAVELLTNPEERVLTEEDILIERCQSAMEAVMYADAYHIAVSADLLRVPSSLQTYYEAEYWKSYENRLGKYTPDDDISTTWRMEWKGQTYKKQEENDPYGWREEDFLEIDENRLLPWFHEVDWNRDSFSVEHHEVSDDTEEITLHHIQQDFYQPEYTMTFLLDKNGKLLRIDRKWVMYQGQACEGIYTTEFISFDAAEVAAEFEQVIESNPAVFTTSHQTAWPGYHGTTEGYVYYHTAEREKKWEEDILYLAEAMLAKHPLLHDGNAYIYHGAAYEEVEYSNAMFDPAKQQAFIDGVNVLIPQLTQMSDERIPFEINRVMALTGDETTTLLCNPKGMGLPLSIEPIWNREQVSYHIVRIPEGQQNLLFGELTAINNKSIEEITDSLKSYVAYSKEHWIVRWLTGMDTHSYLTARGALEAAGVVNANADTAEITVQTDAGSQTVTLPFLNLEEQMQMPRAFGHLYGTDLPPYRYLDERNIWCETWEDTVYLQIIEIPQGTNELDQELNKTIRALRDTEEPAKLIIDLRIGAIGNAMISRFKSFASRVNDIETDGVYILIDSLSQHHAPATAYRLKQWIAGSILVGSPTGHPINRFVSSGWDSLPNSKLFFSINEKYAYLDEGLGNAVLQPDVLVQQTLADYKNGIDTVLEYVLSIK